MNKNDLLIFIMALGTFGIVSTELGIIGILPQIAEYFNVGVDQAGLFVSSFSLIIAITSLFVPLLLNRFDRKKTFILVLLIFIITSIISAFTNNFYVALICRIIPAFFYPAYCSLTFSVAADILPIEKVQMGVSKILMGVSAGTVVGVPITSFLASTFDYHAAMLWFAVVNIIALIATIIFFPHLPGKVSSNKSQVVNAKSNIFLISCVGVVILATGVCVSYSYISQFLQTVTHIVGTELSITLFLFGIASIVGTWLGGKLLSTKPNPTVLLYPFVLSFVLLLLYFVGRIPIPTIILVAFWGALDGLMNNILQYWIVSAAPESPEFANGMFFSMMNIGITIGTSIGGVLIMGYGTESIFLGSIAVLLISFVVLALRVKLCKNKVTTST